MPDTTQDAGKAVVERLRARVKQPVTTCLYHEDLQILLAYITALEERNRTLEEIAKSKDQNP